MKLLKELLFISIYSLYIWRTCEGKYAQKTRDRMKHKIVGMDRELTIDAVVKRASVNHLKMYYDQSAAYQIAEYAYKVKRKYTRMVFVYMRCNEHKNAFTFEEHLQYLREVQHIKAFIDNMIQMLEEWEDKDTRQKRITRTGRNDTVEQPNARKVNKIQSHRVVSSQNNTQPNLTQRQRQREYMERKKMLWKLAHGVPRSNIKKEHFEMKNKLEDGFESDMYHL